MQDRFSEYPKVLAVDDNADNLLIIKKILSDLSVNLFISLSGEEALALANRHSFDLILLDIKMPNMDGFEVCRRFKTMQQYKDVPVLFISSLHAMEDKIKAFESGGDDYLVKPLYHREVCARVQAHLHHQMLTKNLKYLLRQSYHELYNPLAVINTSVGLYKIRHGENKYLDAIASASKTLEMIYEDFTYSFTSTEEEAISIDFVALIEERLLYFELMAKIKGLDFKIKKPEEKIELSLKKRELLRIVDNTLSNAIKYAEERSKISLEISYDDKEVVFSCSNRGVTIEDVKSVFKQGYRESTKQIGMGIGLDLVAYICHHNEIRYSVKSEVKLTTFSYVFPRNHR